jgi:hypothetical protein
METSRNQTHDRIQEAVGLGNAAACRKNSAAWDSAWNRGSCQGEDSGKEDRWRAMTFWAKA